VLRNSQCQFHVVFAFEIVRVRMHARVCEREITFGEGGEDGEEVRERV
jgi:hypothetical protein